MKNTALLWLPLALALQSCALMPRNEIPVAVACPPPPPVPAVLTAPYVSPSPSTSERLETSIQERDDSLTRARR